MEMPINLFKRALLAKSPQVGCWMGLANPYAAELMATTGFDWLLIDAEHAPNDLGRVLAQLQALAAYSVQPVVRPVNADSALLKQYLDIGVQTLLLPMIETPAEAARVVAATRYPPRGHRGVGSALARASRWNQIDGYLTRAADEICVLVQIESVTALNNAAEICAVEGVDGIFFGPADLAASLGLLGKPMDPAVRRAIAEGMAVAKAAGKATGTLCSDVQLARDLFALGASFVAVGVDTTLLVKAARSLVAEFKSAAQPLAGQPPPAY
jgi:4-hydroxy-2-oxoheptanedioate aldolase